MGFYPFPFLIFYTDFDGPYLFGGVGQDEYFGHIADGAESSRVGTGLKDVQNFKICQIEDKYFSFQYNNTPFGIDPGCLDLRFATGFNDAFGLSCIIVVLQSSQIMSLFLGCLGV